jgi:2-oxoisovalerate dehydrogenase E2 component (dihydrolipoyl transacylase)
VELGGAEGETLTVGSVLVRIATAATQEPVVPPPSANGTARKPVLVGYGADDAMDSSRRVSAGERPRTKPPVRKLAAELNVDLSQVMGSGPDGVITREDVLAAAGRSAPTPEMVAVRGVQAEMAHRMTVSRRQIPDAHAGLQVDCSGLMRLRERMRDAADDESPVTPFVLTLRLLTIALRHHPNLNSTWLDTTDGPQIHLHSAVHLGFGVAAPRGLLVPVVGDAHEKTTRELAMSVARLIREARAGTLKPSELQGSTFTVSNFGALGLDEGVPVINYPEAAILGMGSLKPRPVAVDGEVVVRPTMSLTCAFDHRIIDGAAVAAFLTELRDLIEAPELALLDL